MPKYSVLDIDDWTVLYKDGLIIMEEHRLDIKRVFEELAPDHEWIDLDEGLYTEEELTYGDIPTLEEARERLNATQGN